MRRRWLCSALVAACIAVGGCGSLNGSSHVDIRRVNAAVEAGLGVKLQRAAPPAGQPGIPALRATFAGGDGEEQVTVLEFYDPQGTDQVLGAARSVPGIEILERRNVLVLYTRQNGPDHRELLDRALDAAPLVKGAVT